MEINEKTLMMKFLDEHRDAHAITYSSVTGLPVKASYYSGLSSNKFENKQYIDHLKELERLVYRAGDQCSTEPLSEKEVIDSYLAKHKLIMDGIDPESWADKLVDQDYTKETLKKRIATAILELKVKFGFDPNERR